MMYYRLIYVSVTNESIFKNYVLFDCRKAKLDSKMLAVVLRRFLDVEKKIDKLAQIQASDDMKMKLPIFPVIILDVIQKEEIMCRSENNDSLNPETHFS